MQAVTAILILGAIASLVAWVILLLLEHGIRPVHSMVHFVRRLPWSGRLAVLPLFIALVVYGSVKNHSNERGEMSNEIGSESVSNRVDRVEGDESGFNAETQSSGDAQSGDLDNVANVGMLPIANTNSQLEIGNTGNSQLQTHNSQLTQADCEAGFVLSGVGYGEEFDFAPPENAVVCDDWLRFGAHEDWFHLPLGWFSFPFGSNVVNALTVLSSGTLYPAITNASTFIAPLKASLGIVPMANWERIVFGRVERVDCVDGCESDFNAEAQRRKETQSCFWFFLTPSNTLQLTWQNVLLERDIGKPVSFQCEISHNGDFIFRYDLKSIATTNEVPFPKVEIGAKNSAQGVLIDSTATTSNLCDTTMLP
jgi:hypothetical protein